MSMLTAQELHLPGPTSGPAKYKQQLNTGLASIAALMTHTVYALIWTWLACAWLFMLRTVA